MTRCLKAAFLLLALSAGALSLSELATDASSFEPGTVTKVHRALRTRKEIMAQFAIPPLKRLGVGSGRVVTVYLVNMVVSLFYTDILTRYGTGRIVYDIVGAVGSCDLSCEEAGGAIEPPLGPCLAVTGESEMFNKFKMFKGYRCPYDALRCNYPTCRTMLANDEGCLLKDAPFDFRQYHAASLPSTTFSLPLGPRLDTWQSFQKLYAGNATVSELVPASRRKYAFNAVFSQSTHPIRAALARQVKTTGERSPLIAYAKMAATWAKQVNSPKTEQVDTDKVVGVLHDSAFTLSPRGHHPECYRLFEAAEAGSVPVLTRGGLAEEGECDGPLDQWEDAPWVVLETWEDLYPTLERLMADQEELDRRQRKFVDWYQGYVRGVVRRFEDILLESSQ